MTSLAARIENVAWSERVYSYRQIAPEAVPDNYHFDVPDKFQDQVVERAFGSRNRYNGQPGDRYLRLTDNSLPDTDPFHVTYYERFEPASAPAVRTDAVPANQALTDLRRKLPVAVKAMADSASETIRIRQVLAEAVRTAAAKKEERNAMLREAREQGMSYRELEALTGLSRVRLDAIVNQR